MLVQPDGSAPILDEVDAHDEAQLQERIKTHPELLPIDELGLAGPLMVVGRETTLPSGAIDLACLTPHGELLLVEFKTGPQNPDFRHSLAQLLDYGSDLWSMDLETFESTVARRYFDSDRCPADAPERRTPSLAVAAARRWIEVDTVAMTSRLRTTLQRGALHYIVVAQRFTEPMLQTIAYLNEVTVGPAFHAIELVRFQSSAVAVSIEAFEARTVSRGPSRSRQGMRSGPGIDEEQFLASIADDQYRDTLENLLEACRGLDLRFEWGSVGTSIRLPTTDRAEPVSIAWLFPPDATAGWMGLRHLTLGFDRNTVKSLASGTAERLARYAERGRAAARTTRGARDARRRHLRTRRRRRAAQCDHRGARIDLGARVMASVRPRASLLRPGSPALGERLGRMWEPHVSPLNELVRELSKQRGIQEPWFDPDGGGIDATIMFLLESPGPRSTAGRGSGIISPDNDDDTAENTWLLRERAGIPMADVVHWNAVPWYLEDGKKPTAADRTAGARWLARVIDLMPRLRVVVLAGNQAKDTWHRYRRLPRAADVQAIATWHPAKLAIGLMRNDWGSERNLRRQQEAEEVMVAAKQMLDQTV